MIQPDQADLAGEVEVEVTTRELALLEFLLRTVRGMVAAHGGTVAIRASPRLGG
jgi:hypothetical protein